jgi:hypothetical protein
MKLNENYAKRQHSSKKYEVKRSAEKERMPSVYISKAQKEMLGTLRLKTDLHQGLLLVTGINVLTALHANGVDIKELIDIGDDGVTQDDKEKLVTAKIKLFVDSLTNGPMIK